MPPRGKQPHERVCVANWRRSLCAAKRPRTPAGVNGSSVGAAYMPPAAYPPQPVNGKGGGLPPSLAPLVRKFSQQSVGAGHARPAALLCHPFAFCIVGRGLDPSAASRRRPVTPLPPNPTPNSSLLTPPHTLPFPKLYKLYMLYTKPAPSLQNLYRDCTVLWSKPAQNRGTISLLPVKHWQNIQTIPYKFGKKGE